MTFDGIFSSAHSAGRALAVLSADKIDAVLTDLADATEQAVSRLLQANAEDLGRMDESDPRYDRLRLTEDRLRDIASDLRKVASLPSPLGKALKHKVLPNGLELTRISVPFGVIGVIFEARPNVCFDCFALCLKAGSACVLKGGSDAEYSCKAIVELIHEVLSRHGLPAETVSLLTSHEATDALLKAVGYVDLIIPRGSQRLINYVRDNARVPVIETGAGVVHTYVDRDADLQKAIPIVVNAKTRRVSVCNALDCLLVHKERLTDLPAICMPLWERGVVIEADEAAYEVLSAYNRTQLCRATENSFGTEYLSLRMAVKTVADAHEAVEHISRYGSGHSESIVTENEETARLFLTAVDASCVYHNAPTSFTDGAQFGLGAEIGISTQKLHARGPMALEEITTYKWIIRGNGQTRP
ncbi:MAG: glutamate-5-semialdehyde dehydrogenase [Bacteroidaceae bacterium]|nr:glutamate-5-semialdehyde dehydrogenase [Bacteroidaceae bacterium]MBQ5656467.1 glutamate-5-semialdehyde dehydrogenase [Bacteroidaceae bacterium]